MTFAGTIMLVVSVGLVLTLTMFCFYKIFTEKPHTHHAPIDIETKDTEE